MGTTPPFFQMPRKARILIVDDQPEFVPTLQRVLPEYLLHAEPSAAQAHTTARCFDPDLVIVDMIMADGHGLDVAGEIQCDPDLAGTPIILLSAMIGGSEEDAPFVVEGFPAFGKPFNIGSLRECIEQQLAGRKSHRSRTSRREDFESGSSSAMRPGRAEH